MIVTTVAHLCEIESCFKAIDGVQFAFLRGVGFGTRFVTAVHDEVSAFDLLHDLLSEKHVVKLGCCEGKRKRFTYPCQSAVYERLDALVPPHIMA